MNPPARRMTLPQMLADLSRQCDLRGKNNSQGNTDYWRGYKSVTSPSK